MTKPVLYDVGSWPQERIDHARRRHRELLDLVNSYANSTPIKTSHMEGGPGEWVRCEVTDIVHPQGSEMSLLAGEIANALRGALDSTVWQIMKDLGTSSDLMRYVRFPILNRDEDWPNKTKSWLPNAPFGLLDRIELCQPFETNTGYPMHPLGVIRKLNNQDKHASALMLHATVNPEPLVEVEYRNSVPESRFVRWLLKRIQTPQGEIKPGETLFYGVVPDYLARFSGTVPVTMTLFLEIEGSEPIPIQDLERLITYTEQAIWYIQTGGAEYEAYLRNPGQYGETEL